jgi:hypothetical protein
MTTISRISWNTISAEARGPGFVGSSCVAVEGGRVGDGVSVGIGGVVSVGKGVVLGTAVVGSTVAIGVALAQAEIKTNNRQVKRLIRDFI